MCNYVGFNDWIKYRPKGSSITDFDPPLFVRVFIIGSIGCGATSQFSIFVSSGLFRVILLIVFVNQFTAILHFGYGASYHSLLSYCTSKDDLGLLVNISDLNF
jgi:hypothetical protein